MLTNQRKKMQTEQQDKKAFGFGRIRAEKQEIPYIQTMHFALCKIQATYDACQPEFEL